MKKHKCQTFVAKLAESQDEHQRQRDRQRLKEATMVEGCYPSAQAVVHLNEFCFEAGLYIVLTTSEPLTKDSHADKLKAAILSKCPSLSVEWIDRLTIRLQRLFGWGDASASDADVLAATKRGDVAELKKLMPECGPLLDQDPDDTLALLPRLAEALRKASPARASDADVPAAMTRGDVAEPKALMPGSRPLSGQGLGGGDAAALPAVLPTTTGSAAARATSDEVRRAGDGEASRTSVDASLGASSSALGARVVPASCCC